MTDIETTDVENFNGILRERIGRLVRKTKCFSKCKTRLECAIQLFQFYWDFVSEFQGCYTRDVRTTDRPSAVMARIFLFSD